MRWNAGVLGHFFCTMNAELGGDSLGQWDEFFHDTYPQNSIDRSTLDSWVQLATTGPQLPASQ